MSPLDSGYCPYCTVREITLEELNEKKIKPGEQFECPFCRSPLAYSLSKQFPKDRVLLHYKGDPEDLYEGE